MLIRKIALMSAVLLGMAVPSAAQFADSRSGVLSNSRARQARTTTKNPSPAVAASSRLRRSRSSQPARRASAGLARPGIGVRVTVGSHYEAPVYRTERVWVPGCERRVWVPAQYEYRYDRYCRVSVRVLVRAGHYHIVRDPGRWEYRRVRISRQAHCHTAGLSRFWSYFQ